jgi:ADP-ribose pyrophosphatase YjhB (NUDIX family)
MAVPSRHAVRVLLIDEADRVLLVRVWDGPTSSWWVPGGGVELGETDDEAAHREIREETRLGEFELGSCVWRWRHTGVLRDRAFDQLERTYVARVAHFEPQPGSVGVPEHASEDMRWWMLAELEHTPETLRPPRLADLRRVLQTAAAAR